MHQPHTHPRVSSERPAQGSLVHDPLAKTSRSVWVDKTRTGNAEQLKLYPITLAFVSQMRPQEENKCLRNLAAKALHPSFITRPPTPASRAFLPGHPQRRPSKSIHQNQRAGAGFFPRLRGPKGDVLRVSSTPRAPSGPSPARSPRAGQGQGGRRGAPGGARGTRRLGRGQGRGGVARSQSPGRPLPAAASRAGAGEPGGGGGGGDGGCRGEGWRGEGGAEPSGDSRGAAERLGRRCGSRCCPRRPPRGSERPAPEAPEPWAASAPGPWVGTAAGRGRAEAGSASAAPRPPPPPPPGAPRPARPGSRTFPALSSPPRSPLAPPGPDALLAPPLPRLPPASFRLPPPGAVPLHHLSTSLLSLLSRPRARHLQAIRLDPAFPRAFLPPPFLGQPPSKDPWPPP